MLRFLADENFNADIVQAAKNRRADLDLIAVQDIGYSGADDPTVLQWCADHDRLLLTHDIKTIPGHAYDRVRAGLRMPGVFEVVQPAKIALVVEDLILVAECSLDGEWEGRVQFLPLR